MPRAHNHLDQSRKRFRKTYGYESELTAAGSYQLFGDKADYLRSGTARADVDTTSEYWSAQRTADAIRTATIAFEQEVGAINALNVFPVPDGDTGTNMHLTLQAVCDELDAHTPLPDHVDALFKIISRGALMGARGNSGVILYQIIQGLTAGSEGSAALDGPTLARGFDHAAELAYRAVNNPVEGTMLSVIRAIAEACHRYADCQSAPLAEILRIAREAAEEALEKTPDQLPILRQAGVVDAGGQGIVTIARTLEAFARGELSADDVHATHHRVQHFASEMHFLDQVDVIHGLEEYGYCINFVLSGDDLQADSLRQSLETVGTSTVIVGDETLVKIHTHSEHPGTVLEKALEFGDLHDVRIDNMTSQTERLLAERQAQVEPFHAEPAQTAHVPIGIVAVGAGDGVIEALKGMGAQAIVAGGTSMNPSTKEIRDAIDAVSADDIIVLPNDSNIIAAAEHAAELSSKQVEVVPTKSVQQGIAALAAFNFEASLQENLKAMTESATYVRSLAVARANRDAVIDGLEFRAGEYLGTVDGKPRATGSDPRQLTLDLLQIANANEFELVTIFVGEPADNGFVETLSDEIGEHFPDLEVELTAGGQPHYDLLIALE